MEVIGGVVSPAHGEVPHRPHIAALLVQSQAQEVALVRAGGGGGGAVPHSYPRPEAVLEPLPELQSADRPIYSAKLAGHKGVVRTFCVLSCFDLSYAKWP